MAKVYPMMITCPDGAVRTVKDNHQHSVFMGAPYGVDGKPIKESSARPTHELPPEPVMVNAVTQLESELDDAENPPSPAKNKGGRPRKNPQV